MLQVETDPINTRIWGNLNMYDPFFIIQGACWVLLPFDANLKTPALEQLRTGHKLLSCIMIIVEYLWYNGPIYFKIHGLRAVSSKKDLD